MRKEVRAEDILLYYYYFFNITNIYICISWEDSKYILPYNEFDIKFRGNTQSDLFRTYSVLVILIKVFFAPWAQSEILSLHFVRWKRAKFNGFGFENFCLQLREKDLCVKFWFVEFYSIFRLSKIFLYSTFFKSKKI